MIAAVTLLEWHTPCGPLVDLFYYQAVVTDSAELGLPGTLDCITDVAILRYHACTTYIYIIHHYRLKPVLTHSFQLSGVRSAIILHNVVSTKVSVSFGGSCSAIKWVARGRYSSRFLSSISVVALH